MKKIIILAGPSGVGKTAVSNYLSNEYRIPRVTTHTTRPKRDAEQDGKSYYFETNETFEKLHLFEHVTYGNYKYGSSSESLKKSWAKNDIVSIIVETDGVKKYIEALGEKVYFIYLTISDLKLLKKRLELRGDSEAEIKKRLTSSEFKRDLSLDSELKKSAHIIVNDNWSQTIVSLNDIIEKLNR